MCIFLPPPSLRAIAIAGVLMAFAWPASGSTTPSSAVPAPGTANPMTNATTTGQPLDLEASTIREAVQASAQETNDGATVRDPAAQAKAFRELLPACNGWVGLAEFTVLAAACLTDHCGDVSQTGYYNPAPLARVSQKPRATPATCVSKGVKLW